MCLDDLLSCDCTETKLEDKYTGSPEKTSSEMSDDELESQGFVAASQYKPKSVSLL